MQLLRSRSIRYVGLLLRRHKSFEGKHIETVPAFLHEYLFGSEAPSSASVGPSTSQLKLLDLPPLRGKSLTEHLDSVAEEKVSTYRKQMDAAQQWNTDRMQELIPEEFVYREGWTRYDLETGKVTQVDFPCEECVVFDVETVVQDAFPKGKLPTMATALSEKAWYSWCSTRLIHNTPYPVFATTAHLIPLCGEELSIQRLIIGHNVGFDRVRTREPYLKQKTGVRYLDTMSMAISMFGMADHQQSLFESDDLSEPKQFSNSKKKNATFRPSVSYWEKREAQARWKDTVTKVSLAAVHEHLYRNEIYRGNKVKLSKADRDSFVEKPIEHFRHEEVFQKSMAYCARDVVATAEIFQRMLPTFTNMFPHPASLFGLLSVGNSQLPINQYWPMFYEDNEKKMHEQRLESIRAIVRSADQLQQELKCRYPSDLWLWCEDWTPDKKLEFPAWYIGLFKKKSSCLTDVTVLDTSEVVGKSKLIAKVFGMVYGPYPLFDDPEHGWGYLVPDEGSKLKTIDLHCGKNGTMTLSLSDLRDQVKMFKLEYGEIPLEKEERKRKLDGLEYYQLPNDTKSARVGSPFSKPYKKDLEAKVMRPTRYLDVFEKFLESSAATDFWVMYSQRFGEELHVWHEDECEVPPQEMTTSKLMTELPKMTGVLAPAIVPSGTVSRRSVHKLWVTMTNAKDSSKIGTHLKSMVQAPEGYRIVGADVDSQEQWLAALFGDASDAHNLEASERRPGRTPFSNMMLVGSKSDNSDLHSVVARDLGISRDQAKTLNYARLYGSGRMHAENFLRKTGVKDKDAAEKATQLFDLTKGKESGYRQLHYSIVPFFDQFCKEKNISEGFISIVGNYFLPEYLEENGKLSYDFEESFLEKVKEQMKDKAKDWESREKMVPPLYENFATVHKYFSGGFESSTFNFLRYSSMQRNLRTPILGCMLGNGLSVRDADPDNDVTQRGVDLLRKEFERSVMNWVVQSSAVDFLHLLLLCMEWLCDEYAIEARFSISIHDEVRFVCTVEDAERCALALVLSNMYVRAYISQRLRIEQLPMNVAFFSQVDVDTVLRKEVNTPCENPDGTVPENGEAWDVYEIIKRTGGKLSKKDRESEAITVNAK